MAAMNKSTEVQNPIASTPVFSKGPPPVNGPPPLFKPEPYKGPAIFTTPNVVN